MSGDLCSVVVRAKVRLPMRRAAVLVPVLAAVAIGGCGSAGSSGGSSHASAEATIARAASVSSAEPGYRMTLALTENLGSQGQLTASGSGSFSTASKSGSLSLKMKLPGTTMSALGSLAVQMIITNGSYYMKLPSSLSTLIPGGKQWMTINIDQLGKASSMPGLGSLVESEGSISDPGQYLSYLRATSASGLEDLGSATVDGVSTTHYAADLDLNRLPAVVPAADRAATDQLVAKLKRATHVTTSADQRLDRLE